MTSSALFPGTPRPFLSRQRGSSLSGEITFTVPKQMENWNLRSLQATFRFSWVFCNLFVLLCQQINLNISSDWGQAGGSTTNAHGCLQIHGLDLFIKVRKSNIVYVFTCSSTRKWMTMDRRGWKCMKVDETGDSHVSVSFSPAVERCRVPRLVTSDE